MKVVLSRKGFDSAAGGVASPILPDGSMISLPIPDKTSPIRYQDVELRGHSLGRIVYELTRGKKKAHFGAHLDPDLVASAYPRAPGWRALFGQADREQTVLAREGVGPGDLFLFFGWFRRVELIDGAFRFEKGAPDVHVLWGWMQIDRVLDISTATLPAWTKYHPHVASSAHRKNNTLYVARNAMEIDDVANAAGAGVFSRYDDRLRLTKRDANRSVWSLPSWFEPKDRPPLGYHADSARWSRNGDQVELQSVARGQEFVLDTSHYPQAIAWVRDLLSLSMS